MDQHFWRILLIDDDEDDFLIVRNMLSESRHEKFALEWARSYTSGWEALQGELFDAILVDYSMGAHNGTEIVREAVASGYPAPFILLTGQGNYEIDIEAMEAGAADYLNKTEINTNLLERAIRYAIERKKTEEALRDSKDWLSMTQRAARCGSWEQDIENGTLYWSPELVEIIGIQPEDAGLGDVPGKILPAENLDQITEYLRFKFDQREPDFRFETRVTHAQTGPLWIENRGKIFYDPNGRPTRMAGISLDITERKEAELALEESRKETRDILESISDGFFALDRNWCYTYINRRAAEPLDYQPEELIGKNLWEVFPRMRGTIAEEHYYRAMEEGIPAKYRILGAYSQRWYDINVYPSENGISVFSIDRTDQEKAEEELRQSEMQLRRSEEDLRESKERFQRALENIPDVVVLYDRDLRIQYINGATRNVTGRPASDFIGRREDEVWPPEVYETYLPTLVDALQTGTTQSIDTDLYLPNGNVRSLVITCVPLLDENGSVREMLGITQDFTERNRMAAEAEEGKRILDALMEYVPEGITIADAPDGKIRMVSKYGINILGGDHTGITAEEMANRWKIYHPDGKTSMNTNDLPIIRAIHNGETVRNFELIQVSSDMRKLVLLCNAAPIHSADGDITGGIVSWQDITERKQVEEKVRNMEVQRKLLEYREKERQDIARDLHDGPVQDLSGLIFNIQFTKEAIKDPALQVELEQISLALKSTVHELRSMINELRPPSLIRFGFSKAMQFHIDDFREKHPEIRVDANLMEDEDSLSEQIRLTLYRILQEGLNNIARHSHASRVSIDFHCCKEDTILIIHDNGDGFSVSNNMGDYTIRGHFGLVGMRERAESVGGHLVIESVPGQGTKIMVSIPTEKTNK